MDMSNRPQYKRYVHVMYMYLSSTSLSRRQKFSSPRGVFRVTMMMMDGSGDKLDNVPICRPRAGGCTTYMYVYVYVHVHVLCVCVCNDR